MLENVNSEQTNCIYRTLASLRLIGFCGAVLLLAGQITTPVRQLAWEPKMVGWPNITIQESNRLLREGLLLGIVGGLRSLTANFVWLQSYLHWEKKDLSRTEAKMRMALLIDSRSVHFWQSAARIMAYDFPHWAIRELQRAGPVDPQMKLYLQRKYALQALDILQQGLRYHPEAVALYNDLGMIHYQCLQDPEGAAEVYGYACYQPGAPWYYARLRGEMLKHAGKPKAALEWYKKIYPQLPEDVPAAQKKVVGERIKALEKELFAHQSPGGNGG